MINSWQVRALVKLQYVKKLANCTVSHCKKGPLQVQQAINLKPAVGGLMNSAKRWGIHSVMRPGSSSNKATAEAYKKISQNSQKQKDL